MVHTTILLKSINRADFMPFRMILILDIINPAMSDSYTVIS